LNDNSLLILDDDAPLRTRLRRAMETRGFEVTDAGSVSEGIDCVRKSAPAYAILDMKLEDGSGLSLVSELRAKRAECRIVMLTGFGNIATAVAAVKAGALDYLPKPARSAYDKFLSDYDVDPTRAVMLEDIARNLEPAHAMGMTTVWVRSEHDHSAMGADGDHVHHAIDDLVEWLESQVA
jgi:ActR/RegA family two-component response regulator